MALAAAGALCAGGGTAGAALSARPIGAGGTPTAFGGPGGVRSGSGATLARPVTIGLTTRGGSLLGAQEALATLSYLPARLAPPADAALAAAAADPVRSLQPGGYTYALADRQLPETLTVYAGGRVVVHTLANTGIPASPTANGSFLVYHRLASQVMTGTTPWGTSHADPVSWVAYFNGGDAIHWIGRSAYVCPPRASAASRRRAPPQRPPGPTFASARSSPSRADPSPGLRSAPVKATTSTPWGGRRARGSR